MHLIKAILYLSKIVNLVSRKVNIVAIGILAVMMFFTVTDVCMRLFLSPIASSYELTQFMMAIVVSFGLAYAAVMGAHIGIEIAVSRLPQRAEAIVSSISELLAAGILSLIAWQSFVQAKILYLSGLVSAVLHVPVFPFVAMAGFGFAVAALVFLTSSMRKVLGK